MHIKKILLLFTLILSSNTFAFSKDDILGLWLSKKKDGVIKIVKKEGKYQGYLVWLKPALESQKQEDVLDLENPEDKLKTRKLLGIKLLWGFKFEDDEWSGGSIYDPVSGKTYSSKMSLENKEELNLRGYIGISLFGRTEKWKRIDSLPPKI